VGPSAHPSPFAPKTTPAHHLKGEDTHTFASNVKKNLKTGTLAFEPLFAFCLMDPFMRFSLASPAVAELTGYSVAELGRMGVQEIVDLESLESTMEAFDKVDRLDWSHYTVPFYRKDGVHVEAQVDTIRLAEDRYLWWIREIRVPAGAALKL